MTVDGLVQRPQTWSWAQLHALPETEYAGPIHCVTTWSKFDTRFAGVGVDLLLDAATPTAEATHGLATSTTGYPTNLPLEHLRGGQAWVVWSFDGQPLARDHGGPVRLLVPHLYFWKSAKWVTRLTLLDHDQQGFWERNGYHGPRRPLARAALPGRLRVAAPAPGPPGTGPWVNATVRAVTHPRPRAVILRLEVPDRIDHLPGQHYVIRLTADDGYAATRSYSVASAPADPWVELYVEELADGEVSPYLAGAVEVDDQLEVRGPIGGWFVWDASTPALGLAGGSGVVPLVAMLRHARDARRPGLLRLAVAARTQAELPYADELAAAGATVALSREDGPGGRPAGRLRPAEVAALLSPGATCFVCGSTAFATGASDLLVSLGVDVDAVRVERFGASG